MVQETGGRSSTPARGRPTRPRGVFTITNAMRASGLGLSPRVLLAIGGAAHAAAPPHRRQRAPQWRGSRGTFVLDHAAGGQRTRRHGGERWCSAGIGLGLRDRSRCALGGRADEGGKAEEEARTGLTRKLRNGERILRQRTRHLASRFLIFWHGFLEWSSGKGGGEKQALGSSGFIRCKTAASITATIITIPSPRHPIMKRLEIITKIHAWA